MQWVLWVAFAGSQCRKVANSLLNGHRLACMRFGDHGDRPELGGKQNVATSLLREAVIYAVNGFRPDVVALIKQALCKISIDLCLVTSGTFSIVTSSGLMPFDELFEGIQERPLSISACISALVVGRKVGGAQPANSLILFGRVRRRPQSWQSLRFRQRTQHRCSFCRHIRS